MARLPLHMRLPKLKGFRNPFKTEYQVVNLDKLASLYPEGGEVTVEGLVANGAVRKNSLVKVLGQGEISVALQVTVDAVSGSAKEKITAAGGTVTELV
ncbi:ribosomal protein L15 [Streptomyces umbrinus]|uniref:50S ribosomal protein L15 n=1 Tax=Streptomyces umbrinus TaxID=67370 RepID=A0ABU0SYS5_9ACTN|nr:ribosomal protein L15 [Streptomyces umbrinus]